MSAVFCHAVTAVRRRCLVCRAFPSFQLRPSSPEKLITPVPQPPSVSRAARDRFISPMDIRATLVACGAQPQRWANLPSKEFARKRASSSQFGIPTERQAQVVSIHRLMRGFSVPHRQDGRAKNDKSGTELVIFGTVLNHHFVPRFSAGRAGLATGGLRQRDARAIGLLLDWHPKDKEASLAEGLRIAALQKQLGLDVNAQRVRGSETTAPLHSRSTRGALCELLTITTRSLDDSCLRQKSRR